MAIDLKTQFTLLIPTYNRHELLERLLNYFQYQHIQFQVIVLDSSDSSIVEQNTRLIATLSNNVKHIVYSNNIEPFKKFSEGFQQVSTPFCSLCADDDIIIINTITDCINFLIENSDYSLAHGLYFDFSELKNEICISRLIYSSLSLADVSPVNRIAKLMQNYEATTYAIYRTEIAKMIFQKAATLSSVLSNELLSSVLSVVKGKAARLPKLYCGRNNQRFTTYFAWHPMELIAIAPKILCREYSEYRQITLELLEKEGINITTEIQNIIDIAHMCYISPYLRTEILNFILDYYLKNNNQPPPATILWQYVAERHSYLPSKAFRFLYKLKNKIIPSFSVTLFISKIIGNIIGDFRCHTQLSNQKQRHYRFTKAFLKQMSTKQSSFRTDIRMVINSLDYYY